MHKILSISVGILVALAPLATPAAPQCSTAPEMLLVLDRSGSMTGQTGGKSKWSHATSAVNNLSSKYASQIGFALMVFPGVGDCGAGSVNVAMGLKNQVAISNHLAATFPTGKTPLGDTLKEAYTYLTKLPGSNVSRAVLLITDGSETCGGEALDQVKALSAKGMKTYVVGFGSGVSAMELSNLALQGGTALPGTTKYYKADSAAALNSALQNIGDQFTCCGNGQLDFGETCDKAIPTGQKGACPKSAKDCDDKKACTDDMPSGSECGVICSNTQVTTPKGGDGCCPPGANAVTDSDCPATCGNGVLETGETCDPGIKSGAGVCKTAADCDDKDLCTGDTLTGTACNPKCDNSKLSADPVTKDGCCPKGLTLQSDADCLPKCGPDKEKNCIDLCKGVTCPDGQYCNSGKCLPWPKGPADSGGLTVDAAGDGGPLKEDGCACGVAAGGGWGWLMFLALVALVGRYRGPRSLSKTK